MAIEHYLTHLRRSMEHRWDFPAMQDLDGDTKYSFKELASQIEKLHVTFRALGIKKGDKIALCGRNCANWGVTFLAINSYPAVVVSILPDFTGEGIEGLVNHSDAVLLYTGPNVLKKIDFTHMPNLKAMIFMDDWSLAASANKDIEQAYQSVESLFKNEYSNGVAIEDVKYPTDNLQDVAVINYTSGTTSAPKGVMLTHMNLTANVDFAIHRIPHKDGDHEMSMLPLAHMFGLMFEFLYQICDGTNVYFLTKAPSPSTLMRAFAEVQPYMILTVPLVIEKIVKGKVFPIIQKPLMRVLWKTPGINRIIRNKVRESLLQAFGGKLRYLIMGGAALNPEVEQVLHDIKICYCVGYGMTECAPLISYEDWFNYTFHSVGKAIAPYCDIRIDSDDPIHTEGEIQVKGLVVMKGYYKNEEATKAIFTQDGWMRTGDIGTFNKDGDLFIRGRIKNMILGPSGQNIYPEEIEDVVNNQPAIAESVVVSRDTKLVALVYPDDKALPEGMTMEEQMKANLNAINDRMPVYSKLSAIEIVDKPFEKTPKMSIKRFMYK